MEQHELWRAFADTGEPMLYLWYKMLQGRAEERNERV